MFYPILLSFVFPTDSSALVLPTDALWRFVLAHYFKPPVVFTNTP